MTRLLGDYIAVALDTLLVVAASLVVALWLVVCLNATHPQAPMVRVDTVALERSR